MALELELQAFLYRVATSNAEVERLEAEGRLISVSRESAESTLGALDHFSPEARLQARRMGDVYELLYCLENSVRELIEATLKEKHGPENWWTLGVPESIRKAAEKRKQEDLKARWHGPRGDSPLSYVDFPQYADIITSDWALFEGLLGDQDWVTSYFREMNLGRRALAHTGRLTQADVERMELRVRDWLRVVG